MKLIALILAVTSTFAFAKGSSYGDDDMTKKSNCLVEFNDENTIRFINVSYIKSIEVKKEKPNQLRVNVGSTYGSASAYIIDYKTNDRLNEEMLKFIKKINACN